MPQGVWVQVPPFALGKYMIDYLVFDEEEEEVELQPYGKASVPWVDKPKEESVIYKVKSKKVVIKTKESVETFDFNGFDFKKHNPAMRFAEQAAQELKIQLFIMGTK